MHRIHRITATTIAALALLMVAAGDGIDGDELVAGTINAEQVGASLTYVRAATVTVQPRHTDTPDPACAAEQGEQAAHECAEHAEGAGLRTVRVTCPSGNVASGSIVTTDDGWVSVDRSYPSSDATWRFELRNDFGDAQTVQARVVCL